MALSSSLVSWILLLLAIAKGNLTECMSGGSNAAISQDELARLIYAECWNETSEQWTMMYTMRESDYATILRFYHKNIMLDGELCAIGGMNGVTTNSTSCLTYVYGDLEGWTWQSRPSKNLITPRANFVVGNINGKTCVTGGFSGDSLPNAIVPLVSTECYTSGMGWAVEPSLTLPSPRVASTSAITPAGFCIFGGAAPLTVTDDVLCYNGTVWEVRADMQTEYLFTPANSAGFTTPQGLFCWIGGDVAPTILSCLNTSAVPALNPFTGPNPSYYLYNLTQTTHSFKSGPVIERLGGDICVVGGEYSSNVSYAECIQDVHGPFFSRPGSSVPRAYAAAFSIAGLTIPTKSPTLPPTNAPTSSVAPTMSPSQPMQADNVGMNLTLTFYPPYNPYSADDKARVKNFSDAFLSHLIDEAQLTASFVNESATLNARLAWDPTSNRTVILSFLIRRKDFPALNQTIRGFTGNFSAYGFYIGNITFSTFTPAPAPGPPPPPVWPISSMTWAKIGIFLGILVGILILVHLLNFCTNRRAKVGIILTLIITVVGLGVQCWFGSVLNNAAQRDPDGYKAHALPFIIFLIVPTLLTLIVNIVLLRMTYVYDMGFNHWAKKGSHKFITFLVALCATSDSSLLCAINSGFLGTELFLAPLLPETLKRLSTWGLVGNLLANTPRLIIQGSLLMKHRPQIQSIALPLFFSAAVLLIGSCQKVYLVGYVKRGIDDRNHEMAVRP